MASGRRRRLRAVAPLVALVMVGGVVQARPEPVKAGVYQTPPTTRDLLKDLLNQLFPTTTAPPTASPAPASGAGSPPPTQAPSAKTPLEGPPPGVKGPAPLVPFIDLRPRAGVRNNGAVLEALRDLEAVGFTDEEAMAVGMGRFPIAGPAYYSDGFLEPRPGHYHQGVDITAGMGTPIRAPGEGIVRYSEEGGYGKVATVTFGGVTYFMAHLDGFAEKLSSGSRVKQGQIVGYVGSTGNSTGPHVHLEVRPGSGGVLDPKPILDQWLDEALAAIPVIIAQYKGLEASLPRALSATGQLRRFDERPDGAAAALDALAWASSVSPNGAVVPLAEQRMHEIAAVEQSEPAVAPPTTPESWRHAEQLSRAMLSPLTPAPLGDLGGGAD